ncbi:24941_t:CDS:1, partial [Gigaspora rosea]
MMLQGIKPQGPRMYNTRERQTKTSVSNGAEPQKTRPDEDRPDTMKLGSSKERPDLTKQDKTHIGKKDFKLFK